MAPVAAYPVLAPAASICPWWGTPTQGAKSVVLLLTVDFHFVESAIVELLSHPRCRQPPRLVSQPTCATC